MATTTARFTLPARFERTSHTTSNQPKERTVLPNRFYELETVGLSMGSHAEVPTRDLISFFDALIRKNK